MEKCKSCGGAQRTKNGYVSGKQRYKCKECGKTYREGDLREKYDAEKKLKVIQMYREGIGIRTIERQEGVSNSLIIYWIRKTSDMALKNYQK
jgi:transposase-like protein